MSYRVKSCFSNGEVPKGGSRPHFFKPGDSYEGHQAESLLAEGLIESAPAELGGLIPPGDDIVPDLMGDGHPERTEAPILTPSPEVSPSSDEIPPAEPELAPVPEELLEPQEPKAEEPVSSPEAVEASPVPTPNARSSGKKSKRGR